MMPRILNVCTLPESDIQWEDTEIITVEDENSLQMDDPQIGSGNDDFTDLFSEVDEESIVNVETSESEMDEDLEEFTKKNFVENAALKQTLVATLARGICDDISQFNYEQKNISKWPLVDNQACTDVSVEYDPVARADTEGSSFPVARVQTEGSSFPSVIVKTEENSFPFAKVKNEGNSFPFASIKTEKVVSDTESSCETETIVKSHVGFQPWGALHSVYTTPSSTVIGQDPGRDKTEPATIEHIVINGLRYQKLTNNQTCALLTSQQNLQSLAAAQKSLATTDTSLKTVRHMKESALDAKVPGRKVLRKAKSILMRKTKPVRMDSPKRCLVCNAHCLVTENRKIPSLPFCKKCKKSYFYQLSRRNRSKNTICHSGETCKIDYRQRKMCHRCHFTKFLAVLSAARKAFKEPLKLKIPEQYSGKETCEYEKRDWSVIRDEILLREALICQPRVLLKRVDEDNRFANLPGASKVAFTKQQPPNVTNLDGQVTGKISPCRERKISENIILKLLSAPSIYSPLPLTQETSNGSNKRNGKLSRTDQGLHTFSVLSSQGEESFRIGNAQEEVASLTTTDSISGNVSTTKMSAGLAGLVKDVLNQHGASTDSRLVSRYSGREIRRIDFNSHGSSTCCPAAKTRRLTSKECHTRARAPKKTRCDKLKVSVFMCGHVCGMCTNYSTKTSRWLEDHRYSKSPPLRRTKCSEIQEIINNGTSSEAALILKKLLELNKLLQRNSNMLLELKNRPLQHESRAATKPPTPSKNWHARSSALQNASAAMVKKSSTHEIPRDTVNTSLSNMISVPPTVIDMEQSQLLQELQINATNTSQPAVSSLPATCIDLLRSLKLAPASVGRQPQQLPVFTADQAHSFNTLQSLAVTDFKKASEISTSFDDINLEQSQLLQELQINATDTSQPAVSSVLPTFIKLQQSLQPPPASMRRQLQQMAVSTADLAQSLAVTNCREPPEVSTSFVAPSPRNLSSIVKSMLLSSLPLASTVIPVQPRLISVTRLSNLDWATIFDD